MNAVSTVANSQRVPTKKGPLGEPVFDLDRTTDQAQNRKAVVVSGGRSPVAELVKSKSKGRKDEAKGGLVEQKEDMKVLPTIKRTEFNNNLEGAGDGFGLSNNWCKDGNESKMHLPSYLQPTLSYRMKCVHRTKNDTEDGKRIPFVVGNYANKSHNVGAKIQETLSLIKGAPKRVLEKARREKDDLRDLIRCTTAQPIPPLAHSQGETTRRSTAIMKRNRSANSMDDRTMSIDYKNHQFRTVLMNLQDELAKMNAKYEELKKSLKAKYSVEVAHKVLTLEEELNAKDVEINAFVNLYNEVIQLKKILINRAVEVKKEGPNTMQLPSEEFHKPLIASRTANRRKSDQLSDVKKIKLPG